MKGYTVDSNGEKVYIHNKTGCVARLCVVSGEFFEDMTVINKCSFEQFQKEALNRGYKIADKHRPEWA